MDISGPLRMMIVRSSFLLLLAVMSGCSMLVPTPPEPIETTIPEPPPQPEPVPEPAPVPEPPPVVEVPPFIPPEPQNIEPLIAVVISDRTPAYVEVSDALDQYLDHHEVYDLSDRSWSRRQAFDSIAESGASAVVAVGLPAAQAAKMFSTVPVVVGQVFNVNDHELLDDNVKAVAVLPPMDLQIKAWRELDPTLRNVGAILGPRHDALIAETEQAMSEHGIKFHYAIAETDRETLYLFNRLVRDIDGFILFPDNRILSRDVLNEMMSYASRHRVQVAVFNEPLLEHGATFSSETMVSDIAATITRVLDEIIRGNIDSVTPLTGLSEIDVRTSGATLRKLGLVSDFTETTNTVAGNK
jgi:ABC-type uncharacterized transport system substrate-binding protein